MKLIIEEFLIELQRQFSTKLSEFLTT